MLATVLAPEELDEDKEKKTESVSSSKQLARITEKAKYVLVVLHLSLAFNPTAPYYDYHLGFFSSIQFLLEVHNHTYCKDSCLNILMINALGLF